MAETAIAWCDFTFNGWIGCEKVSPACRSCYASVDTYARVSASRGLPLWGPDSTRHVTSVANWRKPLAWDRKAASMTSDHKPRVFAHSLSDIGEDRRDLDAPREWLWELIRRTPNLQWLLLTKRPENLRRLVPEDILLRCWVGTTAEDQQRADERIPHLLATPAAVRFLSVEPMLGPVDLTHIGLNDDQRPVSALNRHPCVDDGPPEHGVGIDWVISGGESGPKARPFDLAWARSLRDQCRAAAVPFFFKQTGSAPQNDQGCEDCDQCDQDRIHGHGSRCSQRISILLERPKDRAGADPAEWPEDLRVREWPGERTAAKQK